MLFHRKLVSVKRTLQCFKLIIFVLRPAGNGTSKTTNMSGRYVFLNIIALYLECTCLLGVIVNVSLSLVGKKRCLV